VEVLAGKEINQGDSVEYLSFEGLF